MKMAKVINNNVISAFDENQHEIILVGTGIGFQGKPGKNIDDEKIQKVFRLEDPKITRRMKELLSDLPMNQLAVSTEIISYAKKNLETELNENIYVTLTDHIHFAIQRYKENMVFPNPMRREVRLFYEKEYALGMYALELIHKELGIDLPTDEAVSIALHLVSAEFDTRVKDTMMIVSFLEEVMDIVKDYFQMEIDEASLTYERFITHLKFLSRKLFSQEKLDDVNDEMQEMIRKMCPKEYACAEHVQEFIETQYNKKMTPGELAYLTMHIERVRNSAKERRRKRNV